MTLKIGIVKASFQMTNSMIKLQGKRNENIQCITRTADIYH